MAEFEPYRLPEDHANPYAPPEAELGRSSVPDASFTLSGGVEPFTIGAVVSRAWDIFKQRMGIAIGIVIGAGAINVSYSMIGNFITAPMAGAGMDTAAIMAVTTVWTLIGYALQFWITAGETLALLKLARGQEAEFGDVFRGGHYLWRFLWASILYGFVILGVILVCAIPPLITWGATRGAADSTPVVLTTIPCVIVGLVVIFYVLSRFSQYTYLLVDRDCGAIDALRFSFELTRGHVMEVIALILISGVVGASGALACFVGLFFTMPLSVLIMACTYVLLTGTAYKGVTSELRDDLELI